MKPQQVIRRETGLLEGICDHGIGHPLYASADWVARSLHPEAKDEELDAHRNAWMVHGCCGICCWDHEWQISLLEESVRIANNIIKNQHRWIEQLKDKT